MQSRRLDRLTVVCLLGTLLLSALFEFGEPINRDVAGFIYLAREFMFHHKIPYQDIIDFNPPFSTWLFMPMVAFCRSFKLSSETTILACLAQMYVLVVLGAGLIWSALKTGDLPISARRRALFIVLFFGVAVIGCAMTFGQREQLILLFVLPQMLLACAAARKTAKPLKANRFQRIASGILAFAAIAMKPHYIVALLLPESIVWLRRRSLKASFRPETLTVLVLGIAYTLIIVAYYPALFSVSGKAAIQYYHDFAIISIGSEAYNFALLVALFVLRFVFRSFGKPSSFDPLLAGVVGVHFSYLVQQMGMDYQKIPFEALAVAWILLATPALWPFKKRPTDNVLAWIKKYNIRYSVVSLGILTTSFFLAVLLQQNSMQRAASAGLSLFGFERTLISEVSLKTQGLLHRYADGKPVTFFGTAMEAFPAVVYEDLELANRWGFLWPLPGELKLPVEKRGMLAQTLAEDLRKQKPGLILVNIQDVQLLLPYKFDYVAYFSQWEEFRTEWKNYERIKPDSEDDIGIYAFYRRIKP